MYWFFYPVSKLANKETIQNIDQYAIINTPKLNQIVLSNNLKIIKISKSKIKKKFNILCDILLYIELKSKNEGNDKKNIIYIIGQPNDKDTRLNHEKT